MSAAEKFLRVLSVNDGTDVCIVLSRLVTNVNISQSALTNDVLYIHIISFA